MVRITAAVPPTWPIADVIDSNPKIWPTTTGPQPRTFASTIPNIVWKQKKADACKEKDSETQRILQFTSQNESCGSKTSFETVALL